MGSRITGKTAPINPMIFFDFAESQNEIPTDSAVYLESWFHASNGRMADNRQRGYLELISVDFVTFSVATDQSLYWIRSPRSKLLRFHRKGEWLREMQEVRIAPRMINQIRSHSIVQFWPFHSDFKMEEWRMSPTRWLWALCANSVSIRTARQFHFRMFSRLASSLQEWFTIQFFSKFSNFHNPIESKPSFNCKFATSKYLDSSVPSQGWSLCSLRQIENLVIVYGRWEAFYRC
jgi:hypothetical protein